MERHHPDRRAGKHQAIVINGRNRLLLGLAAAFAALVVLGNFESSVRNVYDTSEKCARNGRLFVDASGAWFPDGTNRTLICAKERGADCVPGRGARSCLQLLPLR